MKRPRMEKFRMERFRKKKNLPNKRIRRINEYAEQTFVGADGNPPEIRKKDLPNKRP